MKFNGQTKAIFLLILSTFFIASAYAVPDGLVLWMSMDDVNQTAPGAIFYDISGYGNNGTAYGSAVQTDGYFRNGTSFNGSIIDDDGNVIGGDYIEVIPTRIVQSQFTVSVWVKTAVVDDGMEHTIIGTRGPLGDSSFDFKFSQCCADAECLSMSSCVHGDIGDGTDWLTYTSDALFNYTTDTWYHIVYVINQTGYTIYADGDEIATGNYTDFDGNPLLGNPLLFDTTGDHHLFMGQVGYNDEFFNGTIDEVMIFNRSLSADEIKSLYTPPTVNLDLPQDSYTNNISQYVDITFNASVSDGFGLQNCMLWIDYEGAWQANQTMDIAGTSNTTSFTLYGLTNKTFIWNIQCYNLIGSSAFSSVNRTITLNWTPFCGDGICNNDETCSSCSSDCGQCAQTGGGRHGGSSGSSTGITYIRRANTSSEIISTPAETTVTEPVAVEKTSLMTTATVAQPTLMRNVMGSSILQIESVKGAGLLLAGLLSSFFIIILAGALLKNRELFYVPTMIIEMLKMPKIKWPKLKFRFLRI